MKDIVIPYPERYSRGRGVTAVKIPIQIRFACSEYEKELLQRAAKVLNMSDAGFARWVISHASRKVLEDAENLF